MISVGQVREQLLLERWPSSTAPPLSTTVSARRGRSRARSSSSSSGRAKASPTMMQEVELLALDDRQDVGRVEALRRGPGRTTVPPVVHVAESAFQWPAPCMNGGGEQRPQGAARRARDRPSRRGSKRSVRRCRRSTRHEEVAWRHSTPLGMPGGAARVEDVEVVGGWLSTGGRRPRPRRAASSYTTAPGSSVVARLVGAPGGARRAGPARSGSTSASVGSEPGVEDDRRRPASRAARSAARRRRSGS